MKTKIYTVLMVSFLLFMGCQQDRLDSSDELDTNSEMEQIQGEIQYTSKEIIQKMLKQLPELPSGDVRPPIDTDDNTFGCVTLEGGLAFIEDGCQIKSGAPEIFDDCDIIARGTVGCGIWVERPDCLICVMWFVADCDGETRWTYGYNIICAFGNPQEL
ncbi:hypothetical protein ACJD0Z_09490 [Flavobacteriaceae bacterium M23B6Z8]